MANAHERASAVRLLADHLDAILAAGEDIVGLSFDPSPMIANGVEASTSEEQSVTAEQFVRQVGALELATTLRVIAARTRAEELAEFDSRFDPVTRLFVGGTVALVDAAERAGIDAVTQRSGASTMDPVSYLRSRGVLSENDAGLPDFDHVTISEAFRLCAVAELGDLLDMTAAFLDALEVHYDLFPAADEGDTSTPTEALLDLTSIEPSDAPNPSEPLKLN